MKAIRANVRRLSSCEGKVRFDSFSRAQQTARLQARRHKGAKIAAYHCTRCNGFHTGTRVGKEHRNR